MFRSCSSWPQPRSSKAICGTLGEGEIAVRQNSSAHSRCGSSNQAVPHKRTSVDDTLLVRANFFCRWHGRCFRQLRNRNIFVFHVYNSISRGLFSVFLKMVFGGLFALAMSSNVFVCHIHLCLRL